MREDRPLNTREVATYCHVSQAAVWRWIKQGRLQAYRLPGGQYRIERAAFRAFLRAHNMPIDPEFFRRPSLRILVVDDEPDVVEIAVRGLQHLERPVEAATAADGFEAGLQIATFRPDLLVLDLLMPQVDGFEVCRVVRKNPATAHIKILILTAHGTHDNIQRALRAGADAFMHKPVDLERLREQVTLLLADEG